MQASRIKSFKEMVEEQRGLGLVIPIGDEDMAESANSLRERREAAAKENARSYARGFSVSGPSGATAAALALSTHASLDAESALPLSASSTASTSASGGGASAGAGAKLPQNYGGARKMSLPGEVQLDSLRNGLRLLDFEEYHEAGVYSYCTSTRTCNRWAYAYECSHSYFLRCSASSTSICSYLSLHVRI